MIEEKYVILDIETHAPGEKPDPETDHLRYVGLKGYHGRRICYHYTQRDEIQRAINAFPYLVGHNIKGYDQPVLERHGYQLSGQVIDTLQITERRVKAMMYIDLLESGKSLAALCELFNLQHKKGEFDYSLLEKDVLEGEEYRLMEEYLFGDLDATEELFLYYYDFFSGFKDYMSDRDKERMSWLTCSSGTTAYKAICNMAGLREEYNNDVDEDRDVLYGGGFVAEPYIDERVGEMYSYDASSLYPHVMMGGCLYSPAPKGGEYWQGNTGCFVYPSVFSNEEDGINGKYMRHHGPIERTLQELYKQRCEVTKRMKESTDEAEKADLKKRRLAIKILLNSSYGVLGSPLFKSVHTITGASDCTAMARRSLKHCRTMLQYYGYEVLYSDTDSVYLIDKFGDKQRLDGVINEVNRQQRESMNVPIETHGFVFEHKIKHMWFFRDDANKFIKKNYVALCDNGELIVKGLKILRGECSKLGVMIWNEVIKPLFLDETYKPYTYEEMLGIVKKYAEANTGMLIKRYRTRSPESYKSTTGIHYQIAKRYGPGEHWLIGNKRLGPGKGVHYATKEELLNHYGPDWIDMVKLDKYVGELRVFIEVKERKLIK